MSVERNEVSLRVVVIVVLLGCLAALLAVELLFRAVTMFAKTPQWSDRPVAYFMPEPSRTLQDKTVERKKPGTFRITVVGDSFTFGPGLQLIDTFPKKLESFLNLNSNARPVEVLNRGFSGYSTVDEVNVVKNSVNDDTDLLILEITLNDAEPRMLSMADREKLFGAQYLQARIFKVWSSLGFLLSRIHNSKSRNNYIEYHSKYFLEPETYQSFATAVATMNDLCKAKGIPMVVTLFPLFDFPIDEKYPLKKVHKVVGETVKNLGLPFLDLAAAYRGVPHERMQVIPGQDSHPNEIAHRIAAERLLAFLAQQKVLPEETLPRLLYPQRKAHLGKRTTPGRVWKLSTAPLLNPNFFSKKRKLQHAQKPKRKKKRVETSPQESR